MKDVTAAFGLHSKKGSVDQIKLKSLNMELISEPPSQLVSTKKLKENESSSVQRAGSTQERQLSKQSAGGISDKTKHRLDKSVKLHELSR